MNNGKLYWLYRLCDPETGERLYRKGNAIYSSAGKEFPIIMGIPDFLFDESKSVDRYTKANISWYEKEDIKRYEYMWSQYIDSYSYNRIRRILEDYAKVKLKKETVYLDLGCGFGYFSLNLLDETKIIEHHALDVHFKGLHKIIERAAQKSKNIQAVRGTVYNLPYIAESFDLITANGVLHHLGDMHKAALQIEKIISQDGYGVFIEPTDRWKWAHRYNPFSFVSWRNWWRDKNNNKNVESRNQKESSTEPGDISINSWVSELKSTGLDVRVKRFHFLAGFYRCWIVSHLMKKRKFWPFASLLYNGMKIFECFDHLFFRYNRNGFYYLIIVHKISR
jgi:ubiquinone/menaquinone biosynthesis C-methylase UbiE